MKDSRELDVSSLQSIITDGPTPLFATISGAHLYGFASADSDVDIRGSFVLPIDTVIGLESAEETWQVSKEIDGLEVDWVAHDVAKFITMMMKKNGYVLEQLYSPLVVYGGEWLDELRELGQRCIVRYLYHHYRGFYNNECKMMAKAGATAKSVLYAYRVLLTGVHVLETGTIEANLPNLIELYSPEGVSELISLKVEGTEKQELDPELLQTHLTRLNSLEERLDGAFEKSDLPEAVDNRDDLSDFLVRVRKTLGGVNHWAHQRLLLKVRSGSQAHGLATPESDEDSRGVCVPPKEFLYGLSSFEQWESEGGDHVVFSLQKFVRLALDGNPNIIETLFTRVEDHLFVHPLAQELLERRDMFLSQKVGFKFGRYAIHQLQKIERHHRWLTAEPPTLPKPEDFGAVLGENSPKFPDTASERAFRAAVKHHRAYRAWRKNRNPKRAALEEKYGYDTKHAMHLCRLLKMGCEILENGEVHVFRPDADWLRGVREGGLSYQELLNWVKEMEQRLADSESRSVLPPEPSFDEAEALVVRTTEAYLRLPEGRERRGA